jgi:hypothetical protein
MIKRLLHSAFGGNSKHFSLNGDFFWVVWLGILSLSVTARAQTYLENIGAPTFTTALPVENGSINAANGNLHLEVPLGSYPQRDGSSATYRLVYDSAIWSSASGSWQPNNVVQPDTFSTVWGGWRFVATPYTGGLGATVSPHYCSQDNNIQYYSRTYIWQTGDGTTHSFPTIDGGYPNACGVVPSQTDAFANDSTGYHIYVNFAGGYTIFGPDGTEITSNFADDIYKFQSPTGNYYDLYNTYTDTVGRAVPYETSSDGITYTIAMPQGGSYTVHTTSISINTNFGVTGITEYFGTVKVISEIDLPDGTKYSFTYDCNSSTNSVCNSPTGQQWFYGLLTSMTLPSGGTVSYSWTSFVDSYGNPYRWLSARTTPDGLGLILQQF